MTTGRLLLVALLCAAQTLPQAPPSRALIDQGTAHTAAGRLDDADRVLREAIAIAPDARERGDALRALAQVASLRGDVAGAGALFDRALAEFTALGDEMALGAAWNQRANDAYRRSALEDAERYWLESLRAYQAAGNAREQANILRNLCFLPRLTRDDRLVLLDEAWALAGHGPDQFVAGLIRDSQGGTLFAAGDFASALAHAEEAVRLLESASPQSLHFARALTSLGRVKRLTGDAAAALALNRRAVALLEAARDFDGAAQAAHAMANAALSLQGFAEYSRMMDQAIAYAEKSTRASTLPYILGNYAQMIARYSAGDAAHALRLIERIDPAFADSWLTLRARTRVLNRMGQYADALAITDRQADGRAAPDVHEEALYHLDRSIALEGLGRTDEAIEAHGRAIAIIESNRRQIVSADEPRRVFAEHWRHELARHVELLAKADRMEDALAASERARARAFIDLLAAKDDERRGQVRPTPAAVVRAAPWSGRSASAPPPLSLDGVIADVKRRTPPAPAALATAAQDAVAAAAPIGRADIRSASASLATHFLVYWVGEERTLIWVVAPDGRITAAESPAGEKRLATLIRSTWASAGTIAARAGTGGADEVPAWEPALRGAGVLVFDAASQRAFRELDRLLVAPVRSLLPRGEAARLTIVPHGPLFRLSFAPLISPSGRYLVETARLSYTPSIAALLQLRSSTPAATARSIVVADPELAASVAQRERLARLPGALTEGRAIANVLGTRSTFLTGRMASESHVRKALGSARIVHFATHGVVRDDQPMASYLALGGAAASAQDDGRLTTAEVYELSLDADLVVLSACRSAVGPITGDGISGLTRAFFAAGSRSVMASLWDLPDVVTAPLLARFYREWQTSDSKAGALRRAQLHVINELRRGRIAVDTPAGRYIVPEHPSLWAGLVLMGHP